VKAVLDTNILISAFVFPGGAPEAVYRLGLAGTLELGTSRTLLAEFGRVLTEKFGWEPTRVEAAVAQVARICRLVEPIEHVEVILADPADDRVLEAALAFGADVIVSGDAHVLRLGRWRQIRVTAPAALLVEYTSES
jgi:uncharacterized protein